MGFGITKATVQYLDKNLEYETSQYRMRQIMSILWKDLTTDMAINLWKERRKHYKSLTVAIKMTNSLS